MTKQAALARAACGQIVVKKSAGKTATILRNQDDLAGRIRVFDLRAGRESAIIDQTRFRMARAAHKAGLARFRDTIGSIALARHRRGGGSRRRRRWSRLNTRRRGFRDGRQLRRDALNIPREGSRTNRRTPGRRAGGQKSAGKQRENKDSLHIIKSGQQILDYPTGDNWNLERVNRAATKGHLSSLLHFNAQVGHKAPPFAGRLPPS